MAYERDDDRFGRGPTADRYEQRPRDYDRGGSQYGYGQDRDRPRGDHGRDDHRHGPGRPGGPRGPRGGEGRYGRPPQGYDYEDRGFFERTADEVRSWFGDEEAERRRRYDERYGAPDDRGGRDDQASRGYGERNRSRGYGERNRSRGYGERNRFEDQAAGAPRQERQGGSYAGGSGFGGNGPSGFGGQGRSGFGGASAGSSDLGAGRGAGATMGYGLGAGADRDQWGHDPNYRSWRDRQVESLDRDYDEYRREHQSKFESEFATWRTGRQTQRDSLGRVREHQDVIGSDGTHVGTVDKVRGDQIILTKSDPAAGGHHHAIPSSWIESVDDKVNLRKTAEEAKAHWTDVERNSAFGGDARGGENAPWATQSRTDGNAAATSSSSATASDDKDKDAARTTDRNFPGTY